MTFIYYLCGVLLLMSLLGVGTVIVTLLINPKDQKTGKKIPRVNILAGGIAVSLVVMLVFGGIMSVTEPDSIKAKSEHEKAQAVKLQKQAAEKERLKEAEEAKPKVKTEIKKETVPFETIEKKDSTVAAGERRILVEGVDGERTITYEVTYIKNKEVSKKETKSEVTKPPTTKVVLIGTYVKPSQTSSSSTSGGGYINSQGNYVSSPSSNPAGATAKCRDGSYSYSQSRRGTCSHHGGVAQWL